MIAATVPAPEAPVMATTTMPDGIMENKIVIETRFGDITFDLDRIIRFPLGMPGFGDYTEFGMADLPDPAMQPFKLLQFLGDSFPSFVVLPVDLKDSPVSIEDFEAACSDLEFIPQSTMMLFIVTANRNESGVQLTINTRAPIFINTMERLACQYVLANPNYSVRHPL